jgi:hypothetical protein
MEKGLPRNFQAIVGARSHFPHISEHRQQLSFDASARIRLLYRGGMMHRIPRRVSIAAVLAILPSSSGAPARAVTATAPATWLKVGTPAIKNAGRLLFTGDGILLVGDSRSSALFALDVRDTAAATDTVTIKDIDQKIAARLGTTASGIAINDIAVHPRSRAVYMSVTRGVGAASRAAIARVGAGGAMTIIPLTNIPFAKAVLPNPPLPGQKDDDGGDAAGSVITSLAMVHGDVYVAGLSNAQFASTVRRVRIPFDSSAAIAGLRIYHAHHSKFETRSPITAMTPYVVAGKEYLIASYACTPIAMFAVDSLVDGAKVTGTTIAELGAGTHATSMVNYDWKGHRYLAVVTIGRSIQFLEADSLHRAAPLTADNKPAMTPLASWQAWGVQAHQGGVSGVLRLADFNATHGIALQREVESGALYLRPLAKPIFWYN